MSVSKKRVPFVEDFVSFNESYKAFCRGRFEQERSLIKRLTKALATTGAFEMTGSVYQVLSVGAGCGRFDTLFVEELTQHTLAKDCQVKWTVVDPNKPAINEFKKTLRAYDFEIPGVDFAWVDSKFEDYVKSLDADKKEYNLVLFAHCLYFMEAEKALKATCKSLLAKNGSVFVVAGSKESMAQRVLKEFRGSTETIFIEEAIKRISVQFSLQLKNVVVDSKVKVTEIFAEDNSMGTSLLKFLLRSSLKSVSAGKMKKVIEFIKRLSWTETVEDQEEYFASNETIAYMLSKH